MTPAKSAIFAAFLLLFAGLKTAEAFSYQLQPAYLEYGSTINIAFILESACPTSDLMFLSKSLNSDQQIDWMTSPYQGFISRADDFSVEIVNANFSNSMYYSAFCKPGTPFYPMPLKIQVPVEPEIFMVSLHADEEGGKVELDKLEVIDSHQTVYHYSITFGEESHFASLQLDIGDGSDDSGLPGNFSLAGTTEIISKNWPTTAISLEPDYPHGTRHRYQLSSKAWAAAFDGQDNCTAYLEAITQLTTGTTRLWHEANIWIELAYKPQNFHIEAGGDSTECEITCRVDSACPYVDVELQLVLIDPNNVTLAAHEVTTSSSRSVTAHGNPNCRYIMDLTKRGQAAYATCRVKNEIGESEKQWRFNEIPFLANLPPPEEEISVAELEWWVLLIIVVGGVVLIIIVMAISFVRQRKIDKAHLQKMMAERLAKANDSNPGYVADNNNNNNNNNGGGGDLTAYMTPNYLAAVVHPKSDEAYNYIEPSPPAVAAVHKQNPTGLTLSRPYNDVEYEDY